MKITSKIPSYPKPNTSIALLGGSFDPAHEGHIHISQAAKKQLGVDQVLWLVTPESPTKKGQTITPLQQRLECAKALTKHIPYIAVTDIEKNLPTNYTHDTLSHLIRCYPSTQFVWLMGADNLIQFHRWYRAKAIASQLPICICDRSQLAHKALRSKSAHQLESGDWTYLFLKNNPMSSSKIREGGGI